MPRYMNLQYISNKVRCSAKIRLMRNTRIRLTVCNTVLTFINFEDEAEQFILSFYCLPLIMNLLF
jgi:hypothetical protein